MKILLIKPPLDKLTLGFKNLINLEPLNLEYISAGLSDLHELDILDMTIEKNLNKKLEKLQPDVVGISCSAVHTFQVHRIAQSIKRFNPNILIIVGGEQPTLLPHVFNTNYFDVIVIGEGIFTMREIMHNYEQKKSFDNILGIALPKNGDLIFTLPRKHTQNLDIWPFPNRNLTKKYRDKYYFYFHKPTASICTSMGCPNRCNFCCEWVKTGGVFGVRSPESVVQELSTIEEETVFIVDDNAFVDVRRAERIYELIKEKGINKKYIIFSGADIIVKHPEIIEKWAEIGLCKVCIGLESYKTEELRAVGKKSNVTVDTNTQAIDIIHKNGAEVLASFIIFPDYDEQDFEGLFDYIDKNNLYYIELQPLTPLPGTNLYIERYSDITCHNYELYDLCHVILPTKLPLKSFYNQMAMTYFKTNFYLRAKKVKVHEPFSYNLLHPRVIAFWRFLYSLSNADKAHSDKNIPFKLPEVKK